MTLGYGRAEAWLRTPGEILQVWYYHRLFNGQVAKQKKDDTF